MSFESINFTSIILASAFLVVAVSLSKLGIAAIEGISRNPTAKDAIFLHCIVIAGFLDMIVLMSLVGIYLKFGS